MNWLSFFATIIGSLAWPIVFLMTVVLFRGAIRQRIGAIRRLKYQDVEVDLVGDVHALDATVTSEVKQLPAPPALQAWADSATVRTRQVEELANLAPSSAYALVWLAIEEELAATAQRLRLPVPEGASTSVLVDVLVAGTDLDPEWRDAFSRMRDIRNKALRHPSVAEEAGPETISDYVDIADRAMRRLKRATVRDQQR